MRWMVWGAALVALAGCAAWPFGAPDDGRRGGYRLAGGQGPGAVFLSGSGDEPPILLQKFRDLAGGKDAHIVVGPFAGGAPAAQTYVEAFQRIGVTNVAALGGDPEDVPDDLARIAKADGIYFVGGIADAAAKKMGDYRAGLTAAWRAGAAVGGHSAGAMVWGSHLIVRGDSQAALNKGVDADAGGLDVVAGLGLLPGAIVDPHFGERARFPRLWVASGATGTLGIGVDEGAAAVWTPDGRLTAWGAGAVTLVRHDGEGDGTAARVTVLASGRSVVLADWGVTPPTQAGTPAGR